MDEAKILETTYYHTADISRPKKVKKHGFDDFEKDLVYKDLKCAISFTQGSTEGSSDTVQSINYLATLFARPEVLIKAGDMVDVNVLGISYHFLAGEGVRYQSHIEIPLIRSDAA